MTNSLIVLLCIAALNLTGLTVTAADPPLDYDQAILHAQRLLNDGKLSEAYLLANATAARDDRRWEAFGVMALALHGQGNHAEAGKCLAKALARAPEAKKPALQVLQNRIADTAVTGAPAPARPLSPDRQAKLDALKLIAGDADKATNADERKRLMREFLIKSTAYVAEDPDRAEIWLMRAIAAMELDYPTVGHIAGQRLRALGLLNSTDPQIRKTVALLERREWLGITPTPRAWPWSYGRTDNENMNHISDLARNGDAEAQYAMGMSHLRADGRNPLPARSDFNVSAAKSWFSEAAKQGFPIPAQLILEQQNEERKLDQQKVHASNPFIGKWQVVSVKTNSSKINSKIKWNTMNGLLTISSSGGYLVVSCDFSFRAERNQLFGTDNSYFAQGNIHEKSFKLSLSDEEGYHVKGKDTARLYDGLLEIKLGRDYYQPHFLEFNYLLAGGKARNRGETSIRLVQEKEDILWRITGEWIEEITFRKKVE